MIITQPVVVDLGTVLAAAVAPIGPVLAAGRTASTPSVELAVDGHNYAVSITFTLVA